MICDNDHQMTRTAEDFGRTIQVREPTHVQFIKKIQIDISDNIRVTGDYGGYNRKLGRRIKKHRNSFANANVEGGEPDKDIVVCKNISASDCKNISELHWTTWHRGHCDDTGAGDMSNVPREVQNIWP